MDWESLLPSLPEGIYTAQDAFEHPAEGEDIF